MPAKAGNVGSAGNAGNVGTDKACIVISTFAALRVEHTAGRKFYAHKESLEPHFAAVPPNTTGLEIHTEGPQVGKIKKSCANIMALIRPLVIVDEAHNAKTDLSYDVLNRRNWS